MMLPVMNGQQICEQLAGDVRLRKIPIILMSAELEIAMSRYDYRRVNIAGYLTKPFFPSDMVDKVNGVLRGTTW
jgi:CheY-like chemotaxis protein